MDEHSQNTAEDLSEDELRLAPMDAETDSYRQMIMERHDPVSPLVIPEEEPRFQFSLFHMIVFITVVCVVSGLCQWVNPNIMAGLFGLLTLFSLMVVILVGNRQPMLQWGWVGLVLVYIAFSLYAAYFA